MTDGNASQFVIYQSDDGQIKLDAAPTCREFRQVRTEGTREVARTMAFYAIRATMVTVPIDFSNEPSAQR